MHGCALAYSAVANKKVVSEIRHSRKKGVIAIPAYELMILAGTASIRCYIHGMTRSETIAIIEQSLPSADEATLNAAVELFQAARLDESVLPRQLTGREMELIEQSKEDFKAGRTYSMPEARAYIDAELARRRAERSKV